MKNTVPFKRLVINANRQLFRLELEDARAYARLVTTLMDTETENHEAHLERAVAGLSSEEREAYFDNNSDTYESLLRKFPNQQQQSLIVLTYTVVETRLVAIARKILSQTASELELKDLSGDSPFQKTRKVINKIAGFDIEQGLWDRVEAFRLIRNVIVHNAGEFPDKVPQLVQRLLDAHPDCIENNDSDGLIVRPGLAMLFASACEELMEAVFDAWLKAEQKG